MSIEVNGKKILRIVRNGVYYTMIHLGSARHWETSYSVLYYGSGASEPTSRYVSCSGLTVGRACRLEVYGGIADSTTVGGDYALLVISGGTANNTSVNHRGSMSVYGGNVNSTTVSGGSMTVFARGRADSTTVSAGSLIVSSGGTATNIAAESWTSLYLAIAPSTYIQGAIQGSSFTIESSVFSGGKTISSGVSLGVFGQCSAVSMTISSGGRLTAYSERISDNTGQGGYSMSGACIDYATVKSGGTLELRYTGARYITAEDGAKLNVYVDSDTTASFEIQGTYAGSAFSLSRGNMYSGAVIHSGWSMRAVSEGMLSCVTVKSGGWVDVGNLGYAYEVNIESGGSMRVISRGSAGSIHISGGVLSVYNGGKASSTQVESGGVEKIWTGTALSTWISSGGEQIVDQGKADNSFVGSGGRLLVNSGGSAISPFILSEGCLIVSSGGTALNVVSSAGAIISAAEGAVVTYA